MLGLTLAALFGGLWWGERTTRKFVQNTRMFGTPDKLGKAETWYEQEPEEELEEYIDKVVDSGGAGLRVVEEEQRGIPFSEETIEQGVTELMEHAQAEGLAFSPKEAREEVMLMLNAEGSSIE